MQQTVRIPIHLGSNQNVDEIGLGNLSAELRDAYVDELLNVHKRPGVVDFVDLGTDAAVDGLYFWRKQGFGIAVSAGSIFKIDLVDGLYVSSDITAAATFETGKPVHFVDFGTHLYGANGGKVIQIPATGDPVYLTDVDAPTAVPRITSLNAKLIAQNSGERFDWADASAPTVWSGEYASAERIPDDLQAIGAADARLILLGTQSLEIWRDDGLTPFVPEFNGHISVGCLAAQSLTYCGDTWYWLDDRRNLARLRGNSFEMLPAGNQQSLNQYLEAFTTVSDAVGHYVTIGGRHLYVLVFPTEDETIIYDIQANLWFQWSFYESATETYSRWRLNCAAYSDTWNKHLIGDKSNGRIYEMSLTRYADGGIEYLNDENLELIVDENGDPILAATGSIAEPIRTLVRTGQIDHGSLERRKFSQTYTLTVKRTGESDVTNYAAVLLRYRDNGSATWQEYRPASITSISPTVFRFQWRRNGQYYTRQIEIVNEDVAPLLLVALDETFEVGN